MRAKLCKLVGCSQDEAKLTLAAAAAERQDPNPHYIYRGDDWQLERACELWTTRQVALREEQQAKWTQEVKLATGCASPMASLAVQVAQREPSLVRNGKISAPLLVPWASRWIEERRKKKQSADSYYEESFVQQLQLDKKAKERTGQAQGSELTSTPPKKDALRITREAVDALFKAHHREVEVLPPLNPEDQAVREMVAELLVITQQTYGVDVEPLSMQRALSALEASRYLPGVSSGWPSVEIALTCLEKGGNRELWQWQTEQISKRTGVDLITAREARRAAIQQGAGVYVGDEVVEAGVKLLTEDKASGKRERGGEARSQLGLTRTAVQLLEQEEDELGRRPMLNLEEEKVSEMVYELMEAVGRVYGDEVEPIDIFTSLNALAASRHIPGERGLASVRGALKCLENREGKELWQLEVERIAKHAGVSPMSAREARNAVMRTYRKGEVVDIVWAGVRWLREQQGPAGGQQAMNANNDGGGGDSYEQKPLRGRRSGEGRGDERGRQEQQGPAEGQAGKDVNDGGGGRGSSEQGPGRERQGAEHHDDDNDGGDRGRQGPANGQPKKGASNSGGGGGCDERRSKHGRFDREDDSDSDGEELGPGGGRQNRQARGGEMPPLDLLGGVSGLRERAANATEAGKQQAKGQERAASEEESTPKRQRTSEPLYTFAQKPDASVRQSRQDQEV